MGKPVEIEFLMRNNTQSVVKQMVSDMSDAQIQVDRTQAVISSLEKQLEELKKQKVSPDMDQQNNIAEIEALKNKLKELRAELLKVKNEYPTLSEEVSNTRLIPPDLPKAKSAYNGLHMSIQQIAREMPTLAMGPQMFFLAISNNLPIFSDEVGRARKEYDALLKSGQKGTPVWKQILSSVFSWQTAMTTGILLMVMHGKEIVETVKQIFKMESALDKMRASMQKTYEVEKEAHKTAAKTRFELSSTMRSIKEFNGTKEEERRKVDELNDKYGESFGYYQTLSDWYDVLALKAENYTRVLFLQAKQQSLLSKALEAEDKVNQIKSKPDSDYNTWWGYGGKVDRFLSNDSNYKNSPNGASVKKEKLDKANAELKKVFDEIESLRKEEAEILQSNSLNAVIEGSIEDLQNAIESKRKALKDITNKEDYERAIKEIKIYEDKLKAITGEGVKIDSSVTDIERLSRQELEARKRVEDQVLALKAEGYDKERAQAKLEFDREKERIAREEKEMLDLYEKLLKTGKVKPEKKQEIIVNSGMQRQNAAAIYDNKIASINKEEVQDNQKSLLKLLEPYRTFAQQRLDIEAKYNADMDALRKAGASEDNMDIAREQQQAALDELDLVLAQKDVTFQAFMNQVANMSLAKLNDALSQAESALSKSEAANGKSSDQSAILRAKVNALKNEIKYLQAENAAKPDNSAERWKKNSIAIKSCKAEVDGMLSSMTFLDEATREALQAASNVAGGAIAMIDGIKALSIGAAEGISAVEKASIILAIVGAAVQIVTAIFNMASAAEERHQKALEEVAANKLAMQRQYNLLLLEQNLLMKEASSIFGEQSIAKAARSIEVYRQALSDLHSEMKGNAPKMNLFEMMTGDATGSYKERLKKYQEGILQLSEITIKTGHKKTGLFGWGKGKDIYSSVLEVYDDLIDAEGNLNIERAKAILETQTMSDANKELLQNMIDLQEQAEEALESLRDYLEQTFGSMGEGILESIESAIRDGGINAWEEFGDKGSEVLESLGRQMAYSLFFAEKFKKLQAQLEGVYGSGKSEEEIANEAMQVVGDFYAGIGKDMEDAQDWMEQWKQKAAEHGFDLWSQEDAAQSGRSGAFETMTQDQATKLEGLFTSVQGHVINMDDNLENVVGVLHSNMDKLTEIEENTSYCKRLDDVVTELEKIRRDGIKVK